MKRYNFEQQAPMPFSVLHINRWENVERPDGAWVKYTDVEAEIERARA